MISDKKSDIRLFSFIINGSHLTRKDYHNIDNMKLRMLNKVLRKNVKYLNEELKKRKYNDV